ncbi:minor capsid protein [Vallitalea guaymasensis]|uniref:minor capsid protein n=1 Tax=Vallitalea guaymasensis TaxID=1185412 RepID=UPI000DE4EE93|nr:minor capsid protein [Vallitalea guaymasensis]
MKNSSYWKKRFELIEQLSHDEASTLLHEFETHYMKAQREIEGKINSWYQRFALNNEITMTEARKWLTMKELAEFKWDVKEYIKYGELNEINQVWMKQLENASARYHISRLESLKLQLQQSIEVLFGNQLDQFDALMKNIYSEGYYHTIYEVQKGFNIGWNIDSIDQDKLKRIISKPWAADGQNFSSRLWNNKSKLVNQIHTELTQMTILGKAPDQAIKNIAIKMNTSKSNAGRLVMTESAYFSSVSQKDAFNELDVERFEIVATLDSRTSEICQSLDGHVFDMNTFEAGVTAPPFHPWCRTTTVPYFDDEFNLGERAARDDETGKTYYVPSDIKYPDWKSKFVEGI